DLRGWTWILERDGHVVWVDTSEDPLGLAREGFPTPTVGRGVAEAEGPVRAAYLTAKRLNKGSRSPREWERIGELARGDPQGYRAALVDALGPRITGLVADSALNGLPPERDALRAARVAVSWRRFRTPWRLGSAV